MLKLWLKLTFRKTEIHSLPLYPPLFFFPQNGSDDIISQGGCEDYTGYLSRGEEASVNVPYFMGSSILS